MRGLWWLWWLARLAAAAVAMERLARGRRRLAPLAAPAPADGADGSRREGTVDDSATISVVIPARDEVARLGPLLAALAASGAGEVIVVDDESTDGTAELAESAGATVVRGAPLPLGWVGKPWALQQGLVAAGGEWVVTLDADTVPGPWLLDALVERAEGDGWDLLTVGARFRCDDRWQQALHPAMLTTLVYRFGPPGVATLPEPSRVLANGQCTIFRRDALLAAGGFTAAAGHLTDDAALARHLAGQGWRVGFLDGADAIDVRMYDSAAEAWRCWGRSLPMVDVTSRRWLAADLVVVWLAQALPLVRVLTGRADRLDALLLLLRAGTLLGTRRTYAAPGWAYWASPLLDVAAAARLTQAALRPERTWRGRTYPLLAAASQ
jgi:dolichol-phosphate mannosyltransferase